MLYAITNPVNMTKVEAAMKVEVEKLVSDGVTSSELSDAQKGYLENVKVNRTSDSELASTLADTLNTDRTMEYYAKLEKVGGRAQHRGRGGRPEEPDHLEADRRRRRGRFRQGQEGRSRREG